MKGPASTHTEIYRRFEGRLRPHALRFVPLVSSQIRVLHKKKLPLLLFFGGPAITGIVMSFVVYGKFSLEGNAPMPADLKQAVLVAAVTTAAQTMLEVRNLISLANTQIQAFALLAIGWFGAGLIADDRKLGAHLLYFSRPLTKLDYFLGHFLTVSWFGLLATLGPGLMICTVATFTSPDYSFIKEEWSVVLATIASALFTVGLLSVMTLAISSLARRKSFALVSIVALVTASEAVGGVLSGLQGDGDWNMFGLWNNIVHVSGWLFSLGGGARVRAFDWDVGYSLAICGGLAALSLLVLWLRLRRLEGVG